MTKLRTKPLLLLIVLTIACFAASRVSAQVVKERPNVEIVDVGDAQLSAETAAALDAAKKFAAEKNWEAAAAQYATALVALPQNASLKLALSHAYYELGENRKAIDLLTEVHKADKRNSTAAIRLAGLLTEEGKPEQAKKILDTVPVESATDPGPFILLGIDLMNNNKGQDAWANFNKAVKIAPESHEGYYYRALASMQLRKTDAAKTDLKKVIELAADSPEAKDAKELLAEME